MSEQITITVDGREIVAEAGQMLVDAAKHGDVEIPVFCYEPKLGAPVGACRMCLVEIEGIPKLQTACSTPARDGMVVHTRNDQVQEAQNAVVEFLLINHPLDCPVCDKGGECPLQDIAMGWGAGKSRFTEPKRHFEKPIELSPLVALDRERCILCYRCVRFSQEISEDSQLQLLERGDRTYVGTFDDRPYVAPFHGNITELCPVGALTNYTYRFRARPWDVEEGGSLCTLCPSQCNVKYTIRDEQAVRVLARDNEEVDDGWLCDRGRYGYEMWASEDRLTAPMVRDGGSLRGATWGEALERAAAGLSESGQATAALAGDASNEEGYLLQRLVREALGGADVDSRLAPGPDREQLVALGDPAVTSRTSDLDRADAILVLGTDPVQSASILDLRIRKAVRRNGARLLVASDRPTALDGGSVAGARYAPGSSGTWIAALAAEVSGSPGGQPPEGVVDVASELAGSGRVVVVWGERLGRDPGAIEAVAGLCESLGLADREGSGLLEVPELANGRGLREVGVLPDAGPGLAELDGGGPAPPGGRDFAAIRESLEVSELRGLILLGADPVRDAPGSQAWQRALAAAGTVVAFSMFANESTAAADVVLPLESPAEKEGTVTHPDGRLQRVRPNAGRPGEVRPVWQVLAELNAMLGNETGIYSVPEALSSLSREVPFYAGITAEEIGGRGVRWQERPQASAFELLRGADRPLREAQSQRSPSQGTTDALEGDAGGSPREATAVSRLSRAAPGGPPQHEPAVVEEEGAPGEGGGELVLGTYRDLWAGEVTDHTPALGFLRPAQRLELSPADAERLGIEHGDHVEVSRNGTGIAARALVRERMLAGSGFMSEGIAEGNANRLVDAGPAAVRVERVEPPPRLQVEKVTAT